MPDDPLFPTRRGIRLSRDALERRVAKHARTAAQSCPTLAGKKISPHVMRHSTAMRLQMSDVALAASFGTFCDRYAVTDWVFAAWSVYMPLSARHAVA
jgi:integrase